MSRITKEGTPATVEFGFSTEHTGSAPALALFQDQKERRRPFRLAQHQTAAEASVKLARKLSEVPPTEGSAFLTNSKPGIWIFSTPDEYAVIEANCARYGHPIPARLVKNVSKTLKAVFLPQGGFVTFPFQGQIQFWQRQGISYDVRGVSESDRQNLGMFAVPVKRVVRIAGKSGVPEEIWHNPRYTTSGLNNPSFTEGGDIRALGD